MNPMIGKELRQRMRERRGWILPSLYLVALGTVITLAYYTTVAQSYRDVQGSDVGQAMFLTASYTQLALLLMMAPIFSAGALTIEKEQRTLSGLLTSLLGPAQIWWGKFVASLLYVLLLLAAGLPVLSAVFAFGGVGPLDVSMAVLTTIVVLTTVSCISLYWSSVFRRSVHATAVSYVSVIVMTVVTFIAFLIMMQILQQQQTSHQWQDIPVWAKAPLYFNPFFFLTIGFGSAKNLYPEWITCLVVFVLLGVICALLTLRNLRRGGEDV